MTKSDEREFFANPLDLQTFESRDDMKSEEAKAKEVGENMRTLFDDVDEDGGGTIDKEEIAMLAERLGAVLTKKELNAAFAEMLSYSADTEEVDFEGFNKWWENRDKSSSFDSDDSNKNDASSTRRGGGIKDTSKEGKEAAKKASKLVYGGEDDVIRQGRLGKGGAGMMFDHDDTGRSTASRASHKQKMAKAQADGLRMLGSKSLSADNGTSEKELTDSANAHKGFISDADYVESQPGCCGGGKSKSKGKKGAKRREHDVVAFENPLDEEDPMKDIMKELSKE